MDATVRPADALALVGLDALHGIAEDLAGAFELRPLLERILRRSIELLDGDAGSISSVDEAAGTYRKEADIGVACQSGHVFSLTEGMTGAVTRQRGPVILADYRTLHGGHVLPEDRAALRAVAGVPILWRGAVVGACVVFSRDPERVFTRADTDRLALFARHAAIAIANARLHHEAEARTRAEATSLERDRLVREVHDTVARGLASVLVHLEAVGRATAPDSPAAPELSRARDAALSGLAETRRTVLGLAPSPLEGRTLEEALDLELAWAARTGGLDVRLVRTGDTAPLPNAVAHQLFRITQEALTNAVQHAGAHSVRIGVIHANGTATVLVQDDGQGFEQPLPDSAGVGLRGMTERARMLGGRLEVDSVPGWGTRVRVSVPVSADAIREPRRVRVLVAAPKAITRAGVVRLLASQEPTVEVVGEVDSAVAAADAYTLFAPDLVLLHIDLVETTDLASGCDAVRAAHPDAVVLLLCRPDGQHRARELLPSGVSGWVTDEADGEELARSLLAATRGQAVLPAGALAGSNEPALTPREQDVYRLMRQGLRDRQIAELLVISVKTVEKHVGAILRKTGTSSRTELVALARN